MKKLLILPFVLALGIVACGDDTDDNTNTNTNNNNNNNTPPIIDVSGTVTLHPFSAGVAVQAGTIATFDLSQLSIIFVDPAAIIANPTGFTPLATTTPTGCAAGASGPTCTFLATDVDLTGIALGLVAILKDNRAASAAQFVTANVGIFGGDTAAALRANPAPFTDAPLFAVTTESGQAAAAFTGGAFTYTQMLTNGFLFGLLLDHNKQPLNSYTVTAANNSLNVYYAAPATATANGLFFGVADNGTTGAIISSWTATNGTNTETLPAAGTNPGTVFVLAWVTDV